METTNRTTLKGYRVEKSGSMQFIVVDEKAISIIVFNSGEEVDACGYLSDSDKKTLLNNDILVCFESKFKYIGSDLSILVNMDKLKLPGILKLYEMGEIYPLGTKILEIISNYLLEGVRKERANGNFKKFDRVYDWGDGTLDEDRVAMRMLVSFYQQNHEFLAALEKDSKKIIEDTIDSLRVSSKNSRRQKQGKRPREVVVE